MNKKIIVITMIGIGMIGGGWYATNMKKGPVNTASPLASQTTSTPILTLQWKVAPATQTQEEIDSFGEWDHVTLKLSGIKNEEMEIVTNSICSTDPTKGIITEESPAYKEMGKNNLLMVSCWYAGAGDQFSVNQETPTLLAIKHVAVDEGDDFPVSEYKATIVKTIEIPQGTMVKVAE